MWIFSLLNARSQCMHLLCDICCTVVEAQYVGRVANPRTLCTCTIYMYVGTIIILFVDLRLHLDCCQQQLSTHAKNFNYYLNLYVFSTANKR